MSISKLYITVTNSTYAYQLGNIHPISRLRGDVTTHVREVYNVKVKSIPFVKNVVEYFLLSIVIRYAVVFLRISSRG